MPLDPGTVELLLQQLTAQATELRHRADATSKFGNKLVGGLVVLSLMVGGMQWFVLRQIALLDGLRDNQRVIYERLIVLEVQRRYERGPGSRTPPVDDKEKP